MGRFDADARTERVDLVVDAIRAHRERGSRFVTVEAPVDDAEEPDPWIQFDGNEELLNLDCSDEELHRLERVLHDFGGCLIDERTSPDDVSGTNVRVRTRVDDERVAQLVERCFRDVFGRPADYRLWVTEL
ncbi:MAG: hypothetical protein ABEJ44_06235 [Halanaeroarchaeum sp.]